MFSLLYFVPFIIAYDPHISNGTCWFDKDQQADRIYIPCGNEAIAPQSCCQARDVCLSSKACYNANWGVTYIAGCTVSSYSNSSVCPDKGALNMQEWAGLVRCFVSDDIHNKDEEWIVCKDSAQPTVGKPDACSCDLATDKAAFTDSPILTNIASLPVSVGNAIAWYNGFEPRPTTFSSLQTITSQPLASPASQSSRDHSSQGLSTTTHPYVDKNTEAPSPTPQFQPSTNSRPLTTSTKAGISVGGAVAFILMCSILYWISRLSNRKRQPDFPPVLDQIRPRSQVDPAFHRPHEDFHADSAVLGSSKSGDRSELDGMEVKSNNVPQTSGGIHSLQHTEQFEKISTAQSVGLDSNTPMRTAVMTGKNKLKNNPGDQILRSSLHELPG